MAVRSTRQLDTTHLSTVCGRGEKVQCESRARESGPGPRGTRQGPKTGAGQPSVDAALVESGSGAAWITGRRGLGPIPGGPRTSAELHVLGAGVTRA